ncbi:MAG TPA: hypothetical protein VM802_30445 [Chitinophaga sp.]|uniref:plasmid mobilization protein n=1 Tax=Chitinophaga sp. TaxID=1869181 RepID=UPI002C24B460|nr:hypothetical protein [Chitinophaga sp.]HVI49226.1 hypothetical protein [Chitinophaga sp.]
METEEAGKRKGGRPVKSVKKETIIRVRIDRSELFIIKHKAQKAGMNISAYLRMSAINATVKARISPEEKDLVRKLVGMSNNLNQLTKEFKKGEMMKTAVHFETYRVRIDDILKLLRNDK